MSAETITWSAPEDVFDAYCLRMCKARRREWGDDGCDDRDGTCAECRHDGAVKFETARSRQSRREARAALSTGASR